MTALQNRRVALGRHPLLKLGSTYFEIHSYIKRHPGITTNELADRLHKKYNTVREQIRVLKLEGLVINTGETKITDSGNKSACLRVVTENEGGFARDKITVEVRIRVNEYGEYSAEARLTGQSPLAHEGNPQLIHMVEYEIAVPKPTESPKTRQLFGNLTSGQTKKPVEIEGEIIDIKVK